MNPTQRGVNGRHVFNETKPRMHCMIIIKFVTHAVNCKAKNGTTDSVNERRMSICDQAT